MPSKFICNLSETELRELYEVQEKTLPEMCEIVGCKSEITMAKILKQNNISTDHNSRVAFKKRGNRTEEEFKKYLEIEYLEKMRSMTSIAKELGISWVIVSRYLDKYNIEKRTKSEQQSGDRAPNWRGGRHFTSSGYIEIVCPSHPKKNKRKCVYEHQLVAERMLGRYLNEDEVVHHIDLNKTNNSPDNLVVLTNSDHVSVHGRIRGGMDPLEALKEVPIITK